jgi:hypothetical protein
MTIHRIRFFSSSNHFHIHSLPASSQGLQWTHVHFETHDELGKVLGERNISEGLIHIGKSLELEPVHCLANLESGVILANSGRSEEAASHFRRALERDPNDELTPENLDTCLRQLTANSVKRPTR